MNEVVIRCFLLGLKSVLKMFVGIGLTTGPALGILLYQVSSAELCNNSLDTLSVRLRLLAMYDSSCRS